jgi:metal-dependent hydrolase (beta-lactamase superfamily II)
MLMKISSVRSLRIITLAENSCGVGTSRCLGQWGLSFLLELIDASGDNRKVIFDTGMQEQALLYNMKELKVNLSDLDCILFSHGHLDHTATTVEMVKAVGNTKICARVRRLQWFADSSTCASTLSQTRIGCKLRKSECKFPFAP